MSKNVCIYHANCADGFGAAVAVRLYFNLLGQPCEFIPANYGEAPPNVTGCNVFIVDFSYPRETLLTMHFQADSLKVTDHHKTAEKELEGLDFCHFDMSQSGAMLTFKHLFPNKVVPTLFNYIQDRDLWQWQLPDSHEISAGLSLLPKTFDAWLPLLHEENLWKLIPTGEVVLAYQDKCVKDATSHTTRMTHIMGHTVPIMNATHLVSEVCGELAKGYPFAVTYFDSPSHRVYSLRVREGDVDVSEIARHFGGGGHTKAAGFSIPHNEPQF